MEEAFRIFLDRARSARCEEQDIARLVAASTERRNVYRALLADPRPQDRALIDRLLRAEKAEHEQHDALTNEMLTCVLLLAMQRNPEDCLLIWDAKMANFSTFLGVPAVLLVGAGIDSTIDFLRQRLKRGGSREQLPSLMHRLLGSFSSGPQRVERTILQHIQQVRRSGQLGEVEKRLKGIADYCAESLSKP